MVRHEVLALIYVSSILTPLANKSPERLGNAHANHAGTFWKGGAVGYRTDLLSRQSARAREFESHPFRQRCQQQFYKQMTFNH